MKQAIRLLSYWVIKSWRYCFIGLLFYCFIGFALPSPVLAQNCVPLGTNIAANFDYENLVWIAEHADCPGPIPITVIITPELVQNTDRLMELQGYLSDLGFDPTWRPWGFVDPDSPELQDWINAFSLLEIGQLQTWNEWNRYTEVADISPERDAQVLLALINARNAGLISIPLGNTPLDLLNVSDMTYQEYWTDLNKELINLGCPDCLNQLDFIVSNVYANGQYNANSVDQFLQTWQGELDFLRGLGVDLSDKFFIISEAGLAPGAYHDFNQRLQDTLLFAQALEAAILADPSRFPGLEQITFLLMDDSTGKQYLIYRDCTSGVCVWMVTEYLIFNPNVPGPILPPGVEALTCNSDSGGDTDSRPAPCDPCNSTLNFCPSCATSFTVGKTVGWQWKDRDCANGGDWVIKKWEGVVTIDPTQTTIPFVGKKGNESESFYLADYFEGTTEYYFIRKYPRYWLDWIDHAGVWRKLTPMGYQDILKEDMVERAVTNTDELHEGNIHNYNLEYVGRTCWDLPFFVEALIIYASNLDIPNEIISRVIDEIKSRTHYCVFAPGANEAAWLALAAFNLISPVDIAYRYTPSESAQLASLDGHFPPQPDEENYVERWQDWKKSSWGRLWEVAPMFSRENTPGMIYPYFGWKPMDIPQFGYVPPSVEKVPHVARLYEESQETQRMLFPYTSGMGRGQKEEEPSGPIIATAEINSLEQETQTCQANTTSSTDGEVLGEKTLLAQGMSTIPGCCRVYYRTPTATNPVPTCECMATARGCSPGQTCLVPFCPDATGGPAPAPPTCELPLAFEVPACAMDSITDENPNDPICGKPPDCRFCEPIEVPVVYYDSFNDYPYTPCTPECGCCGVPCCEDYPPGEEPPDCSNRECICDDDPCLNWEHRVVKRGWGINLSHPYLTEIWEQTAQNKTKGLLNIFRPFEIPEFEELDAHSTIDYNFTGGWERPSDGKFYYNYLGGVQKAKEWVTTKELMPYIE
jgi:hypothetical protein